MEPKRGATPKRKQENKPSARKAATFSKSDGCILPLYVVHILVGSTPVVQCPPSRHRFANGKNRRKDNRWVPCCVYKAPDMQLHFVQFAHRTDAACTKHMGRGIP
eukprot:GGOE01055375.1.p7 GENE.GGOE01055375.1~~GGOE01055375.1.p7  ORF type:complete len:105 (-),score=14.98 GGOE01055375.1:119-433(-)